MIIYYDWISCVLWLVEMSILFSGVVCSCITLRNIATDSILHYNFRVLLISLLFRSYFSAVDQTTVIISRAFIYGDGSMPYQQYIDLSKVHSIRQMGFSLLLICFERIISVNDKQYEYRCQNIIARCAIPIGILTPSALFTASYLISDNDIIKVFDVYFIFIPYSLSAVTSLVVYHISKGRLKNRHILLLRLDQKFASTENVRAMRLFIPCVTNEIICFCILLCLITYSKCFTTYEIGSDPTKLSHVYDILNAYKAAFIPCFLTRKYRRNRSKEQPTSEAKKKKWMADRDRYFKELEATWR